MKHDKTASPVREQFGATGYAYGACRQHVDGRHLKGSDDDLRADGWTLIDDDAAWEQVNREHEAERVDATDEVRLAAGWRQQACLLASYDEAAPPAGHAPAPGPAGLWRLHASGVWVRWVVAS